MMKEQKRKRFTIKQFEMTLIDLLKFMLLEFLVDHSEVVATTNTEVILHLYFDEKTNPPEEFDIVELVSKGFLPETCIVVLVFCF